MTWHMCWKCDQKFNGKPGLVRHIKEYHPEIIIAYIVIDDLIKTKDGYL